MTKVTQSTVRIRKHIAILNFHLVSSGLTTHLELIYTSTRASSIILLIV